MTPAAKGSAVKSGMIKYLINELSERAKNNGCRKIKTAIKSENFLWNIMILSKPKYLSKNLAVSPEKIRRDRHTKPASPVHLPKL